MAALVRAQASRCRPSSRGAWPAWRAWNSVPAGAPPDACQRAETTPAELAEADRKDAEMLKQVLMEVMVEDGLPVTRAEEAERRGGAE